MAVLDEDDIILKKQITSRIKEIREAAGLSQTQLAALMLIDRQTIFKWEQDGISIYSISKVCKALNISLSEFFKDM